MLKSLKKQNSAPTHLAKETAAWWESVVEMYELEQHHIRILTLACEAWDRAQQAREVVAAEGLTFVNKHGEIRTHPAVNIERDCRTAFARLVRELSLSEDVEPSRPPRLAYGGKK